MTFPAPDTIFVWRMNATDHAYGIMDYAGDGDISLDRFESVVEVEGTAEDAAAAASAQFVGLPVEFVTDTGAIARIDQLVSEIRDITFSEDQSLNDLKLLL